MGLHEDLDEMLRAGGSSVSKLEAARRQLKTATTMFFNGGDEVSQHSLVMAAHTVLCDIAKKEGVGGFIADSKLVAGKQLQDVLNAARMPQNFFKHADRDAGSNINFFPCVTQFWLFDAARLYVLLTGGEAPRFLTVFFMWFQLRFPDLLRFEPTEIHLEEIRRSASGPDDFKRLASGLLVGEEDQ